MPLDLSEYARHDGTGLAELCRRGEVSAAELLRCATSAIDAVNPAINAIIGARLDAAAQLATANRRGAFYGVPFLIKDLVLHAEGVPCEMGSRMMRGAFVAPGDSELMKRFRAGGLVTIGRTNTPEFGFNASTEPRLYGPTRNPWNPAYSAGGSSGGSAAAVAAGIVPIAHANDGGGSIRIPASACGLVGLKPTRGRVSAAPDYADPLHGMGIEHVVTRSVRDCAAMLDVVEGPAAGDRFIIARPSKPYREVIAEPSRRLRIAFSAGVDAYSAPADPQCTDGLSRVVSRCADLGHRLEEDRPAYDADAFHRANLVYWSSFCASGIAAVEQMFGRRASPEVLESSLWANYQYGMALKAVDLENADAMANAVCRSVAAFFERYDVLLTPTLGVPPMKLGFLDADAANLDAERWYRHLFKHLPYTALYNMTGQPAISLPLARSSIGLPIGIQAVGRFGDEATLLQLAAELERAMPWAGSIPTIHVSHAGA